MDDPKLRTVQKHNPPYPLNEFPADFPLKLGQEIVYLLATRDSARLEGADWEEIFARIIGAEWKPSNVGLDDIQLADIAWGAKTVKSQAKNTFSTKKVRLISGRNSPSFSFDEDKVKNRDPDELGSKVLKIWNTRVSSVRSRFKNVRTVVLVKSQSLTELIVFEVETLRYPPEEYFWKWNETGNLEGFVKADSTKRFTWQHSGSQFTIHELLPLKRLCLRIRMPDRIERDAFLQALKFDKSWIEIVKE